MPVWSRNTARRTIIAIAVMAALVLSNIGIAASHHSVEGAIAEAMLHGSISTQLNHGHAHDLDDEDQSDIKLFGHSHSHNGSDHSHITAGAPPASVAISFSVESGWLSVPSHLGNIKAHFRLDRPPKATLFA